LKNGAEMAIEDINAAGGILGQKITAVIGDDASRPEQGVSIANKFIGEGVRFVIGHFNSGVSIPASEVYNENGVLQITPASTNPTFTERKMWNVFRTCGRDDQQGAVAGRYIAEKLTGEKDFSALISKLRQLGVEVVMWGGLHTEGGLIVRQMRDQGVKATLLGGDGIASAEFAATAGPGAEGTFMTYGPDPTKRPGAKAIVQKFLDRKINPESYTLYSYAAMQVLKLAAEEAKSLDPKKIAEVLHSGKAFDTVIGPIAYDKKGDRLDSDYVMYEWRKAADGKIVFEQM